MKQFVGILILLFTFKMTSSGQSRILTGTLTAAPNTSTTILPHIVQTKSADAQKEDSALFNPRYVPPPPVDNSAFNSNQSSVSNNNSNNSQIQNTRIEESTYKYKTPDSKPYVDGDRGNGTTQQYSTYQSTQKVTDAGADTYQYKTPDAQPLVDNRTSMYGKRYPKRVATKSSTTNEILNQNGFVTNPKSLASSQDYGNAGANVSPKWNPKKTWKRDTISITQTKPTNNGVNVKSSLTPTLTVRNNSLSPTLPVTASANVVVPPKASSNTVTPPIYTISKGKTRKKPVTVVASDNINQPQQATSGNADFKLNLTPDGKYTLTFFNNGGTVTVTEFGRILSVTSPTSGQSASPQYDYRGLLESVGNLPLQYTYEGRLLSVGNTTLGYNYNGNIQSIGNTSLYYNSNGTLDKVGNTKVQYDANGNVSSNCSSNPLIALKQW